MKKAFLILFLAALVLFARCSKDDIVSNEPKNEVSAITKKVPAKGPAKCINVEHLELGCSSASIASPVTFTWNNSKLSYVFNRVYKSYIQIEGNSCGGTNVSSINIPIHFFSTSSYTLPEGRNETCFKYRIAIMGYDKGQWACESKSEWQVFDYSKKEIPLTEQDSIF